MPAMALSLETFHSFPSRQQRPQNTALIASSGAMAAAGIPFSFSSRGSKDRDEFWKNLRRIIAEGLDRQAALDALLDLADHPERGHACDVHFGARVVAVLDAARRSLANGCRIELTY